MGTSIAQPEPVKFPETAEAVLSRLEAEVEMCQDKMQQSRLQAILESLRKHTPTVASGA